MLQKKKFKKTEGCIALNKDFLLKFLKELKINTEVRIANQK